MTALREPAAPSGVSRIRSSWRSSLRHSSARVHWLVLTLAVVAVGLATGFVLWPGTVPLASLVLPLSLASLSLGPRQLPWFVVFVLGVMVVALTQLQGEVNRVRIVLNVGIVLLIGLVVLLSSFRRSRLGVAGAMGESMLVDLRDRILGQGVIPQLPDAWYVESALRSAGGTPFAGDFVVTSTSRTGQRFDIVVVDVSGKGEQAGTRALLLSGAFGGLLTALPPADFLPAANDYLLRQDWDEGFATAVHAMINLRTGEFSLGSAGHPPAVRFSAGSGRWEVLEGDEGAVLGVTATPEFPRIQGVMGRGDALLLYTDGVIETRNRDLRDGIDRMLGTAERMISRGFEGMAAKMCAAARAGETDDRAAVLVWRR
jgi:hypothetical protein